MANLNAPRGFEPVRYADGKPYTGQATRYYKDTTANMVISIGDPVIRVASSSDPEGGGEITRATTGAAITGVVVAIEPKRSDLQQVGYLSATDVGYVLVADDPDLIYEVQEGGSGTALAVTDVGKHIDSVTALDGDTTIGRSKYQIDNNAKATDNTWIIVGLSPKPDNAVGQYAKWLVKANLHTETNAGATDRTET
jgi:hypothetical protein